MPHDCNGKEIKSGDKCIIRCTVKDVYSDGDYCNVNVETDEVMPGNGTKSTFSALNAKQIELV